MPWEKIFSRSASPDQKGVVRRVVHATGDPDAARLMRFHPQAVASGLTALKNGTKVFTDVQMVMVGINRTALQELGARLNA